MGVCDFFVVGVVGIFLSLLLRRKRILLKKPLSLSPPLRVGVVAEVGVDDEDEDEDEDMMILIFRKSNVVSSLNEYFKNLFF